jgi:uncharacterized protein
VTSEEAMDVQTLETEVQAQDAALPATVTVPGLDRPLGGIVALHGAAAPERDFFLYRHLAEVAAGQGWAVLRYDRRPWDRGTIPFDLQAADALAASQHLAAVADLPRDRIGVWGVSQGAWSATVAAAQDPTLPFVILVGYSAWTPGKQMRYATTRFLTRAGHDQPSIDELLALRATLESFLRGDTPRQEAQAHIDRLRDRPWFDLAYVPSDLPPLHEVGFPGLFDFDPTEPLGQIRCPLLAIWGTEDDEVPPEESLEVVRGVRGAAQARTELHLLDGVGHTLTRDDRYETELLDPRYAELLRAWLQDVALPSEAGDRP